MKNILHQLTDEILFSYEGELRSADLSSADLSSADLRYADLSYADLRSADLSSADLSYADLSYADLSSADLRYADLSYADLSYADLRYADLSSADLSYADLRSAAGDLINLGTIGGYCGWAYKRDDILAIRIGCRDFRYAEAVAHWTPMENRKEQKAATEFARHIALCRGWKIE